VLLLRAERGLDRKRADLSGFDDAIVSECVPEMNEEMISGTTHSPSRSENAVLQIADLIVEFAELREA